MANRKGIAELIVSLVFLVWLTACASASEAPRTQTAPLHPRFGLAGFIEEGNLVTFVVSGRAAKFRDNQPYVPMEVVIANRGLENLTLTRESFLLVDEDGRRYPLAGLQEIQTKYGSLDNDTRLADLAAFVPESFPSFRAVPFNLFPSFDHPLLREKVLVPRFGLIHGFLYFPHPTQSVKGQRLELFLKTAELPEPVFVRFVVLE